VAFIPIDTCSKQDLKQQIHSPALMNCRPHGHYGTQSSGLTWSFKYNRSIS